MANEEHVSLLDRLAEITKKFTKALRNGAPKSELDEYRQQIQEISSDFFQTEDRRRIPDFRSGDQLR